MISRINPLGAYTAWFVLKYMKRTRAYKTYPNWRHRDIRTLVWSLTVGGIAAVVTALVIYFANHGRGF